MINGSLFDIAFDVDDIATDRIKDFAKRMQWYPGKNVILQSGDSFYPIYREEEYFLTDMLDEKDIIESSNGYMDGERVTVTSGPLKGYEDKIRRVIRRKSLNIRFLHGEA